MNLDARDHLLADTELAIARLRSFDHRLTTGPAGGREPFAQQHAMIATRCADLKAQIIEWPEVQIGTVSAVEDLGAAVDVLEADYEASLHGDPAGYRSAVDRQLRTWRSRTDRLRLQGALASMEVRDDLDEVGERLTSARSGALLELNNAATDAKQVVVDLREDVENVLVDIRHAIEAAADSLLHSSKQ